jgi:acetolactate synthase I/III small subunit
MLTAPTAPPPGVATTHTLSVLVDDHPGVLNRVASLLRRRRFNVDSLNVGPSEQPGLSRMTIALQADDAATEQAAKQLYKLLEVRKVIDLSHERLVERELALVKVAANDETRPRIREVAELFGARIADVSPRSLVVEAVGSESRIESLLDMLRSYGIREIARTGRVAVARGAGSEG